MKAAEEDRKVALAEATAQAAADLASVRERLRHERADVLAAARAEAARLLAQADAVTLAEATKIEAVSDGSFERAVRLVMEATEARWQ